MNDKDLLYFCTAAECGSLTQAARQCYISQPSLTQSLQRLEQELGCALLVRGRKGVRLTEEGRRLERYAWQRRQLERELELNISEVQSLQAGTIVMGITSYLGSMLLPGLLKKIHTLYPRLKIEIAEETSDDMEDLILQGKVDLAFLHQPVKPVRYSMIPLSSSPFRVTMACQHPLAERWQAENPAGSPFPMGWLKDQDWIMLHPQQRIRQICDQVCEEAGFQPRIVFETRSFETLRALASAGVGVTLLPQDYLEYFPSRVNAAVFPISSPSAKWTLIAGFRREQTLTPPLKQLISMMKETEQEVRDESK